MHVEIKASQNKVIAITKDLPDVEGDRKYQISTFATKLGVWNIAFLGSGILLVKYIVSVLAAIYMPQVNINFQALVTRTGSYNFCNKLDLPGVFSCNPIYSSTYPVTPFL
ncbi:hypothetical protein JHK82_050329 [Glycine max]|nr:hypothetical protein JHK86_050176 [Glycine max]KAG4936047.1 hypothetical protein JHK85_050966 [Glycine max]KAG5091551.1 hypothetical protein JHK82_050329 [Glycine max]KAG5094645.1 hypothetical protein JHK84_050233 [Glycine max]